MFIARASGMVDLGIKCFYYRSLIKDRRHTTYLINNIFLICIVSNKRNTEITLIGFEFQVHSE
jgi:hypothetical protein